MSRQRALLARVAAGAVQVPVAVSFKPRKPHSSDEPRAEAAAPSPERFAFADRPASGSSLPPVFPVARRPASSGEALPETSDLPLRTRRRAVAEGLRSPAVSLPFADRIQRSFGGVDLHGVHAHVGGAASESARALGARAYTSGNHVVFAGRPDLFTAAHETAHVVQQRAGARPAGGIDRPGDSYERQADAVARQVVAGRPVEGLPARSAPAPVPAGGVVQRRVGLEIESLVPVHEAEEDGPGKRVKPARKIGTFGELRLVADHAGAFQGFPGGNGIVELQTPPRSDGEPNKVLEDAHAAAQLATGMVSSLQESFAAAPEEDGKKSAVRKPSEMKLEDADDALELGLKGATADQIAKINGSGRFQINIGVPASAVFGVFGAGVKLLREQSARAGEVYNLISGTTGLAGQVLTALGITPQKFRPADHARAYGFLTLLLQHLTAQKTVGVGDNETQKQHFAFLPKTPLHVVLKTLPETIQGILAKSGELILKGLAQHGIDRDTQLFGGPTVGETLEQILSGADDPVAKEVIDSKPLELEPAGATDAAPVLETRHIRGPRVPPDKWVATTEELLGPLLTAIKNKT